jgi:hypothetical protein
MIPKRREKRQNIHKMRINIYLSHVIKCGQEKFIVCGDNVKGGAVSVVVLLEVVKVIGFAKSLGSSSSFVTKL